VHATPSINLIYQINLIIFNNKNIVKYTSQKNLRSTSPHSEVGTQGKPDLAEAQGFVNNILI
jgi:hypothetical protein